MAGGGPGGSSLGVTDGTVTVRPTSIIDLDPTFFSVTDGGSGIAQVTLVAPSSTPIGAQIFATVNQSIPNTTATALVYSTAGYANGVTFTPGANPLTILTAGKYQINWGALFDASAVGTFRDGRLMVNGATISDYDSVGVSAGALTVRGSIELNLAVNDTIGVDVFQNSAGALNINGGLGFPYVFITVRKVA
jgi:hypothetical protein